MNSSDEEILNTILNININDSYDLYNFILTLKYSYDSLDFSIINEIEESILKNFEKRELGIIKLFQKNIETFLNELPKKNIEDAGIQNCHIIIQLSSFIGYKKEIDFDLSSLFKKIKNENYKKNIAISHITISNLSRHKNFIFYNRICSDSETQEIMKKKVNFTKGYVLIIEPKEVEIFCKFLYCKKIYHSKPIKINYKKETSSIKEALINKNYSSPVFIQNLDDFINNYKNLPEKINEHFDAKKIIEPLNYLNSIKLSYNDEIFHKIYNLFSAHSKIKIKSNLLQKINDNIYMINKPVDNNIFIDTESLEEIELIKAFNDLNCLNLIKTQYDRIKKFNKGIFYLSYKYDSRARIYCTNYPINFQLNHTIRCSINLLKSYNIEKIYINFFNHHIIKKYFKKNLKIYLYQHLINKEKYNSFILDNKIEININLIENSYFELSKYECLLIKLQLLSPKKIINLDDKINFAINIVKDFIEDCPVEKWEKWSKILQLSNKKIPYIIQLHNSLKQIIKYNRYESLYWGDASSNALQLISFRLGNFNKKLLMLTNIINNETKYYNIYNYVSEYVKKNEHNEITKILSQLNKEDISILMDDDISKNIIMPATYGKTAYANFKTMDKTFEENEIKSKIWSKLNKKEKFLLSKYLWNLSFEALKEINFDINEYKKKCEEQVNPNINLWINDYGFPIFTTCFKTSKRNEIMKKIEKYKWLLNNKEEETIKIKIEKLKEKLKKDERTFYKRTTVKIKNKKITARVLIEPYEIDKKKNKTAVTPNATHCYDSAIIIKIIKICDELEIEILPIHDSVGCSLLLAPIIKILFKIVNIYYIEKAKENGPFPFNKPIINDINYNELFDQILESKNFFK